jgi:hypothetical protein
MGLISDHGTKAPVMPIPYVTLILIELHRDSPDALQQRTVWFDGLKFEY